VHANKRTGCAKTVRNPRPRTLKRKNRNFLRPFRGVNKVYLEQYIIIFQWSYNLKTASDQFLRILLGTQATTKLAT
jgi:hypothetical protein